MIDTPILQTPLHFGADTSKECQQKSLVTVVCIFLYQAHIRDYLIYAYLLEGTAW